MNEIAINVENVSKVYKLYDRPKDRLKEALGFSRKIYYKEHHALRDVSFTVHRGETVGIIGTNGAGKSTILKIITGVLNPTGGSVTVNGRISALLELGAGFNMEYSGIENVYLNGTMIGFTKEEIDAKMDDILAFADIGDFVYQPVKTYSSGMFVRLAFAVAINIEPEILIVDEALSVGDAFFQVKCYHKFEEFKKQGRTIVFVSHDLSSVNKYCDRVVLLNKGEKFAEGSSKEMIDLYKKVMATGDAVEKPEEQPEVKTQPEQAQNEEKTVDQEVGTQEPDTEAQSAQEATTPAQTEAEITQPVKKDYTGMWREKMEENPKCSAYGNGVSEIIDYCVTDAQGNVTNVLVAGEPYTIKMKVRFFQNVEEPIFAVTLRDKQGTEICGTNTMYEDINTGAVKAGEEHTATFTQTMNLRGGEYLLCLGSTGFKDGGFEVYSRLYEVCLLRVIQDKDMVGFFNMNTTVDFD